MASIRLSVPCRWAIEDLTDGRKLLRLFLNGRESAQFVFDPRDGTLREVAVSDRIEKNRAHA